MHSGVGIVLDNRVGVVVVSSVGVVLDSSVGIVVVSLHIARSIWQLGNCIPALLPPSSCCNQICFLVLTSLYYSPPELKLSVLVLSIRVHSSLRAEAHPG